MTEFPPECMKVMDLVINLVAVQGRGAGTGLIYPENAAQQDT